jgi:hypothetical protein
MSLICKTFVTWWRSSVNTSPANPDTGEVEVQRGETSVKLHKFLLSAVQPCEVKLVSDVSQQSRPSKTKAELLADGQCEV